MALSADWWTEDILESLDSGSCQGLCLRDLADCVTAARIRVDLVLVLARVRDDWPAEC